MPLSRILAFPLALAVAALAAGCSDQGGGETQSVRPYPVTGKVLLPDGQPLSDGTITFVPVGEKGRQATGAIQPDGTFTLTTETEGDGAGEGEYLVRIVSTASRPGPKKTSVALVPRKYEDEGSSGIHVTVKPESNALEPFKLDDTKVVVKKGKSDDARD